MPPDGSYTSAQAQSRMLGRAAALQPPNMQRFHEQKAKDWQAATDTAFRAQRSPAGEPFPKLAESTLAQRRAKAKGGKSRDARGLFTGNQALNRSGTMRRTTKYLAEAGTIKVVTVPYTPPHQVGDQKRNPPQPPKRNPLVFERVGGKPRLVEPHGSQYRTDFIAHIEESAARSGTGRAA